MKKFILSLLRILTLIVYIILLLFFFVALMMSRIQHPYYNQCGKIACTSDQRFQNYVMDIKLCSGYPSCRAQLDPEYQEILQAAYMAQLPADYFRIQNKIEETAQAFKEKSSANIMQGKEDRLREIMQVEWGNHSHRSDIEGAAVSSVVPLGIILLAMTGLFFAPSFIKKWRMRKKF